MKHEQNYITLWYGVVQYSLMSRRNVLITCFVAAWTLLFHYESLRANYLSPALKRELPKVPLLFPPAGWIMFYRIDRSYGFAEVYGLRRGQPPTRIDPHAIFRTMAVGYDNIHRNMLISVLDRRRAPDFCRYLRRRFTEYEGFAVIYAEYPDLVNTPDLLRRGVVYQCSNDGA